MRACAAACTRASVRQSGGSSIQYSARIAAVRSSATPASNSEKSNQSSTSGSPSGPGSQAARASTRSPRSATQVHSGRYCPRATIAV